MKNYALIVLFVLQFTVIPKMFSQSVSINTTGNAADTSALLDITSVSKGLLIPRMTQAQKLAIFNPSDGLLIYQNDGTKGFYFYNTVSGWTLLAQGSGGITSLNGLTSAAQAFATPGTSGTAPAWTSSGSNHTLNIPVASAAGVTAGLLSNADWNTFNSKASNNNVWLLNGNGGTIPGTHFIGTSDAQDVVFKANNIERLRIVNGVSPETGTSGDIKIGDVNSGTFRSAKELVMREDGDVYGSSSFRLRNRNNENGAIFETIGASANLVDFIFRTGAAASPISSNIRFETRAGSQKVTGNTTEWQFGEPDITNGGPTLVVGATGTGSNSSFRLGNLGIGTSNPATKLHIVGTNPVTLVGVQTGTSTSADSLLTITNGLVRKLPMSAFASATGAIASLNGLTATAQTFTTGSSGADFNIVSTGSAHTFNIPDASATARGLVTTSAQTLAGSKTFSSPPLFSSLTPGSVTFIGTGGLLSENNTNLFWDATNSRLGIGTNTPGSPLHIVGTNPLTLTGVQIGTNTAADSLLTIANGIVKKLPVAAFQSTGTTWNTLGNAGTNAATNFLGTTDNNSFSIRTVNTQRIIVDSLGNVGIGTSPAFNIPDTLREKLLVDAGVTNSVTGLMTKGSINNYFQMNVKNLSSGANASADLVATADNGTETSNYVDLGINGSGYTGAAIQTGKANDGYLISSGNDFYMVNSSANKAMLFLTGGTGIANERMRILANGFVGMGVQDPTSQFVVKDTMEIRRTGQLSQLLFTNTSGRGDFRIGGDGGDLYWQGGGGRALQMGSYWTTILGGDKQGQGGAYPAFADGAGTSGTGVLVQSQRDVSIPLAIQSFSGTQSANLTEWRTSSGTVLSAMTKDGNFGIGLANPATKLHIAGTNPLTLVGVQAGTSTSADSLLTITNGLVRKLPMSTFAAATGAIASLNGLTATAQTFSTGTTGSAPNWSSATSVHTLNIPLASATGVSAGLLSNTDWTTFNNKASATQTWSTIGNAGTNFSTNFLGTTDNTSLRFRTNNLQRFIIDSSGNVAIGNSPTFSASTNTEKLLVDAGSTAANPSPSINVISGKGYINNYLQLNIQNKSNGTSASSDVVATADNGDETTNYVDMGINSSANTSNYFGAANDAYLYNAGGSTGGNFFIGTGTAGKSLGFLTGGGASSNERMRIDGTTGNVGIGITTPSDKLDVAGNIKISGGNKRLTFVTPGGDPDAVIEHRNFSGTESNELLFYTGNDNSTPYGPDRIRMVGEEFRIQNFNNAGNSSLANAESETNLNTRFLINSAGNVGIGTTAPATALHVSAAINPLTLNGVALGTNTTADSVLTITSGLVRKLPLSTFASASNLWSTTGNAGTNPSLNFIGTSDNTSLSIRTNNVQGILLDSVGNVSIGSGTFSGTPNQEKLLVDAGTNALSYNVISGKGTINSYLQLNIQNRSGGTAASSDVVATADNGNETINYVDFGINSSGNASTGVLGGINTGYLLSTGNDFAIGNATAGKSLNFFTGGTGATERMRINGIGNVGIGTTTPAQKLDVNGSINASTSVISQGSIAVDRANANAGTLSPGLLFGPSTTGEGISSQRTTGANQNGIDFYTSSANRMAITNGGNVGIGTTGPGSKLTVAGDVSPNVDAGSNLGTSTKRWSTVYAAAGTINTSDRRLKTNIINLNYGLKEVLAFQPVSYNWKKTPDTDKQLGLIAQDVRKIVPEVVKGDESKENLGMNYTELIPVLINAIKEQQKEIDDLKVIVKKLQK